MPFRLAPMIKGSAPVIVLHRPVLLVGRHLECDVRIESAKISRRHCCLALAYDRFLIRDLGSRNGLRVNGKVVEESRLNPGDELAIGPLLFRVDFEPEADALPAAAADSGRRPAGAAPAAAGSGPGSRRARASDPNSEDDLVPLDDI
jgi:predicted component of type VI protein secretion system